MRLLQIIEDNTMKINEVQVQEATPNYEVNPAQARLSAIAVKLMDKAEETSDINLGIALSKVATHLPEYGTAFGAKNMQDFLDIVNGEGRYAPDADMPQDNKNPIKITKDSLMKMLAYGQKMIDKEGTVKVDIDEDMNSVMAKAGKDKHGDMYMKKAREMAQKKGRKLTPAERDNLRNKHSKNRKEVKEDDERDIARQTQNQIRIIIKEIAKLNEKINELGDMDNGDLTDQLSTMYKYIQGLYAVASRAQKIVPVYEDERLDKMLAKRKPTRIIEPQMDVNIYAKEMMSGGMDKEGVINSIKQFVRREIGIARMRKIKNLDTIIMSAMAKQDDYTFEDMIRRLTMNEAAIPTSEFDYDLMKFYKKVLELEDENQHGEVAEMLVMLYGNDAEANIIRGINGLHSMQGSIKPVQQALRDEISTKYYKKLEQEIEELKRTSPAYTMRNEGVISDLFKASTAEKREKEQMGSRYDAMRLEKATRMFTKQGLSPDDARKYAYRKVYGAPKGVGESSFGDRSLAARQMKADRIAKDVDKGMSMDAIVGKYANKGTTNTDEIRKMVKDYKFKSRMKK